METVNKKGFQLIEVDPMKLDIHELAANNPMMPEDQYVEFIKQFENGFDRNISHIILFKSKVVDGRHRCRACKELGIKVWARNLPGTMSSEEVEEFVEGTENRRHQTATQRAIGAFKYYQQRQLEGRPVTQELAATKKMSNRKNLARARKLADLIGMDMLNRLHNGEKLRIVNAQTGLPTVTDALLTLINYFQNRNDDMVVENKVTNSLTDIELQLVNDKINELHLECNLLVLKEISNRIYNLTK